MSHISKELRERVVKIKLDADRISAQILASERLLQEIPIAPDADFAGIAWDAEKRRIMCGDRPLIECKLDVRYMKVDYLDFLVDRVIRNSEDFINNEVGS